MAWKELLAQSITTADELLGRFPLCEDECTGIGEVAQRYPLLINPYYARLLDGCRVPLWKQAVPSVEEIRDTGGHEDPLAEDRFSPVVNITHRYPDRVLFLVSNRCALHCRFCTRKRKVGKGFPVTDETIKKGLAYIREHEEIRDVLVSGGDPLLLDDERLEDILTQLRSIPHVVTIRIGSRVPCCLPMRVTSELAQVLSRFHPLYINTHFNHPAEITPEAAEACRILADAGIPLGCQTVLLRGVNDSPGVIKELMLGLLRIRVKPYYLHQMDHTRGTAHFRTTLKKGLDILESLRGHVSGMCIPHYVIDLPGGGGKVPLTPEYVVGKNSHGLLVKNFQGEVFEYEADLEDLQHLEPKDTERKTVL